MLPLFSGDQMTDDIVNFVTATIRMDGNYWIAIFQDGTIIKKFGPLESQKEADAIGPKFAKAFRQMAHDNNIPLIG